MALVRLANPEECEAIYHVHVSAIRRLTSAHYSEAQIEAWAGPRRSGDYRPTIDESRMYVAEEAGEVVGFGVIDLEVKSVGAVYVHPEHVRKGIGTEILRALEQRARNEGIDHLRLDASLNAAPFYSHLGYREIERCAHTLGNGATQIPCVVMEKSLAQENRTAFRTGQ